MRNVEQSAITSLRERGISFHPSELHCFEHAAKPCFVLRVEPRAFYQYFRWLMTVLGLAVRLLL